MTFARNLNLRHILLLTPLIFTVNCLQYLDPIDQTELKSWGVHVWSRGGYDNGSFLADIDPYTLELLTYINCSTEGLEDLNVVITKSHGDLVGVYWPFTAIEVTELKPDGTPYEAQLSAYGHELVRWACWRHLSCDWWADDSTWTGDIGEYWTAAENLSLIYLAK